MMKATIDLLGMYKYDNTILDDLKIPEELDLQDVKDNLLMETAELELIYNDHAFLKFAIGSWSRKQCPIWQKLYDTTQYVYNPIWNKDGHYFETETRDLAATEDWTDTHNLELKDTHNLEIKDTYNKQDKETRDLKTTNDITQDDNTYGFNSETAAKAAQTVTDQDTTDTGTDTVNQTGTVTRGDTGTLTRADTGTLKKDRDTTDTGTITIERTETGNIGITTTQHMIKEQREVVQFNIIDVIIKDFIDRFCLKVY